MLEECRKEHLSQGEEVSIIWSQRIIISGWSETDVLHVLLTFPKTTIKQLPSVLQRASRVVQNVRDPQMGTVLELKSRARRTGQWRDFFSLSRAKVLCSSRLYCHFAILSQIFYKAEMKLHNDLQRPYIMNICRYAHSSVSFILKQATSKRGYRYFDPFLRHLDRSRALSTWLFPFAATVQW